MEVLLIFIAGLIFGCYLMPIFDGLIQLLSNFFTLQASKTQKQINDLSGEVQELSPSIGFQYQDEQVYYDDEEEEGRIKGKIGFVRK